MLPRMSLCIRLRLYLLIKESNTIDCRKLILLLLLWNLLLVFAKDYSRLRRILKELLGLNRICCVLKVNLLMIVALLSLTLYRNLLLLLLSKMRRILWLGDPVMLLKTQLPCLIIWCKMRWDVRIWLCLL